MLRLIRRVRYWIRYQREARDLNEELEHHRALRQDELERSGLSTNEAAAASRRALGNTRLAAEDARRVWIPVWIESVFQDLRYAVRSLRHQPGFTVMALLALTLGIGLNISLFTAFNAVLFRGWAVPEADRVVKLYGRHPRFGDTNGLAATAAEYFNENSRSLEGAFVHRAFRVALDHSGDGPRSNAYFVSENYFRVLRAGMARGRSFAGGDGAVAVLSHALWMSRYAGDPNIIGRVVRIDDAPFRVIGVADENFAGTADGVTDLWAPLPSLELARPNDAGIREMLTSPNWCCAEIAARLAPGFTREQARAELNALPPQIIGGAGPERLEIVVTSTALLEPGKIQEAVPAIALVFAAVGSILLLACANVGNLLLARSAARQREISVRVAIGAGRLRILRQLLTESLLLAGIASAIGLAMAYILPPAVFRFLDESPPASISLTPDAAVLLYSIGIAFVAAAAFGLAPALHATSPVGGGVRGTTRFRLRGVLLGTQVAISVTLLVAAALLLRGVLHAQTLDLGFRTEGITSIQVNLPVNSYDPARQRVFFDALVAEWQSQARAEPVGISALMPLGDVSNWTNFRPDGQGPDLPSTRSQNVNAGYFDALAIPFVAGRNFERGDNPRGVVIVNESLAQRYWRDQNPIGQEAAIGLRVVEVIGVVRDSHVSRIGGEVEPMYFAPFTSNPAPYLLVPSTLASRVVAAIRRAEPRAEVVTMGLTEQVHRSLGDSRSAASVAGALGLLALVLATVGVYGVISYSVEQRRKEIGIRMAVGARPGEVVRMILWRNGRGVLAGLAVGLALAGGASVALESELYGVSRLDPVAWGGVVVLLLAAALSASAIPALRAARTDAVAVLHHE